MIFKLIVIVFFILAAFHYFYEALIAPLLRSFLIEKIHTLRHSVQRLYYLPNSNKAALGILDESMDGAVDTLDRFNIYSIYKIFRYRLTKGHFKNEVARLDQIIDIYNDPDVRGIAKQFFNYLFRALVINSGGLLVMLSPLVVVVYLKNGLTTTWSETVTMTLRSFLSPEILRRVDYGCAL